jgi:hypothetical protein
MEPGFLLPDPCMRIGICGKRLETLGTIQSFAIPNRNPNPNPNRNRSLFSEFKGTRGLGTGD